MCVCVCVCVGGVCVCVCVCVVISAFIFDLSGFVAFLGETLFS